jgi:hypothetical protein
MKKISGNLGAHALPDVASENKDRENCADQENLEQRGFCCFGVFFYPLLVFNSYKEYQEN